jgi:uncharacterized protein (DUF58 family)
VILPAARTFQLAALALLLLTLAAAAPVLLWVALAIDVALLAGCLADGRRARRTALHATRTWPPLLVQGARARVDVRFTGERNLRVIAREALHPGLAAQPLRAEVTLEGGPTATTWSYDLVPRRRGTHLVGPLTVRLRGPWGLAWAQRDLVAPQPVRVFPQVRWEGRVGQLLMLAQRRELGLAPVRLRGFGGETYGLKDYRPGDPPAKIHWKSTARHGRLIAREETWERGRRLVILLDCARAMASVQDERSKLDHALAAALALARVAASRSDKARILAFSDRVERSVKVEARGLPRVYAALYDLEARLTEPAFVTLPEIVAGIERRRSTVVLFTSVVDLGAAEMLKDSLLTLSRRHRVIAVNLEDAELVRLAFGAPASVAGAYAKVSAMGIVIANRQLARRLRSSGVRVVTTASDQLAWGALDAYLEILDRKASTATR